MTDAKQTHEVVYDIEACYDGKHWEVVFTAYSIAERNSVYGDYLKNEGGAYRWSRRVRLIEDTTICHSQKPNEPI